MTSSAQGTVGRQRRAGEGPGAPGRDRSTLPIVPHVSFAIGAEERRTLARLAARIRAGEPALADTRPFDGGVEPGLGPWPSLFIEDHSAIALFEEAGDRAYAYRSLLLAGDGDQVVIGTARSPAFEAYCRETLALGSAEVLSPRASAAGRSLAMRCAGDPDLLEAAAANARRAGGLNLVPYMGTGGIWVLAAALAMRAGAKVRVSAPPPRLTRRVNDKLWFARRVVEVLGGRALPPAHAVFGPAALAGRVAALARRYACVGVKLTQSASSAGNIVLDAAGLERLSLAALRDRLVELLRRTGWKGAYPVMVTAWEQPVVASPSVQVWIPEGPADPVIEAIVDQAVIGIAGEFVGAQPTALPAPWRRRLADEAGRLCLLFQELGYFGRCSFDAILVGEDEARAELHWVECNGRWGGVSIPMTLANRLVGDWRRRPFVISQRSDLKGPRRELSAVLTMLGDDLYAAGLRSTGAILLSPGAIEQGTGFQLLVLGESVAGARAQAERVAARLAG